MVALTFSLNITNANAASTCAAMPTCAAMGYTQTSCPSGITPLKCPFDETKLFCGAGGDCEALGYTETSCKCTKRNLQTIKCPFDTSKLICICTLCKVGDIYFDDNTCSDTMVSGKTPLGVVFDVDKRLVLGLAETKITWNDGTTTYNDIPDLTNIGSFDDAKADMNGKTNTLRIVAFAKSSGQAHEAAQYCRDIKTGGKSWFLPSAGQLYSISENYSLVNSAMTDAGSELKHAKNYWSSTEYGSNSAWIVAPINYYITYVLKGSDSYVRCAFQY